MEDKEKNYEVVNNECYIQSVERAAFGAVNGILFYDMIYPYAFLIIIQLILGANYSSIVETSEHTIRLILSLLTSFTTLIVGIIIAKPKNLVKSFKVIKLDEIKIIITTLIIMFAFTIAYNVIISVLGVNVGGGNTNQSTIVDYIKAVPVLAFLAFVVLGPVLEEVTYRYFLFGGLRKINPTFAIIMSGFIFMAVHGTAGFISPDADILRELLLLPPYMFSGCMLAYSYNKSNNLSVSIGIHMLNNLISFILSAALV